MIHRVTPLEASKSVAGSLPAEPAPAAGSVTLAGWDLVRTDRSDWQVRLLARMGLPALSTPATPPRGGSAPPGAGEPAPSRLPGGKASPTQSPLSPEATRLERAIKSGLAALPASDAQRYGRLLASALDIAHPHRQVTILKMLEANVAGAARLQVSNRLPQTLWGTLVNMSMRNGFDDSVAKLAAHKATQLLTLHATIMALPAPLASVYEALLHDIVSNRDNDRRDALLRRMTRQVAACIDRE